MAMERKCNFTIQYMINDVYFKCKLENISVYDFGKLIIKDYEDKIAKAFDLGLNFKNIDYGVDQGIIILSVFDHDYDPTGVYVMVGDNLNIQDTFRCLERDYA